LKTRKWQDKDGKDVYTTEIIAQEMNMLGGREGMGGGAGGEEGGGGRSDERGGEERQARPPASRPAAGKPPAKSSTGFEDMDDDIPF
jgi:single-strand DNA-binding protein